MDDTRHYIVTLPDKDHNPTQYLKLSDDLSKSLGDVKAFPGSAADFAAMISVHELEHLITRQQSVQQYLYDVVQGMGGKPSDYGVAYRNEDHLKEIESDLSVVHALKGQVHQDALQYFAAVRVVQSVEDSLSHALSHHQFGRGERAVGNTGQLHVGHSHSTGFYVDKYIAEPNVKSQSVFFYDTTMDVNSFYDATSEYFFQELSDHFKTEKSFDEFQSYQTSPLGLRPPNPAQMIVNDCLEHDPPVYSAGARVIAERYLDNIAGTLGVKSQSFSTYKQDIEVQVNQHAEDALKVESRSGVIIKPE